MIVDCALYRQGRRAEEPADISDALDAARAAGNAFVWLGLYEPTHEELDLVAREFGLHPLAVEDAVKAHQRPKLERYEGALFVVLRTLHYIDSTSDIESGELMLFIGDAFVLTVRHGLANPLTSVRRRLESQPDVLGHGPPAVLYAVCDAVVDTYIEVAIEVEFDLEELESAVFSPTHSDDAQRIYRLKREVLEFRRAVHPLVEPMRQFAEGLIVDVPEGTRPFFRDVSDHVLRVAGQIETFDDLLTGILSAHLAQVSVRQNEDMRRISAWVAIIAVPTMIASLYGMNFRYIPGLASRAGFPVVLAVMAVLCFVLYRAFKRTGWL
ncbi:MAG: magnesium/cobalt transporter CorA [Streptomycetales bacterium]